MSCHVCIAMTKYLKESETKAHLAGCTAAGSVTGQKHHDAKKKQNKTKPKESCSLPHSQKVGVWGFGDKLYPSNVPSDPPPSTKPTFP